MSTRGHAQAALAVTASKPCVTNTCPIFIFALVTATANVARRARPQFITGAIAVCALATIIAILRAGQRRVTVDAAVWGLAVAHSVGTHAVARAITWALRIVGAGEATESRHAKTLVNLKSKCNCSFFLSSSVCDQAWLFVRKSISSYTWLEINRFL